MLSFTVPKNKEQLWMIPGPTPVQTRVLKAMMRPTISHYEGAFPEILDETCELLSKLLQTNELVVVFPGTGRTAMEAAVTNLVEAGDKVLIILNGRFGLIFEEMVKRVGGVPVLVRSEWGKPVNMVKVAEKLDTEDIKAIAVVHNETATGAVTPVRDFGKLAHKRDVLLIVDTVSSLGGIEVKTDDWNIDFCCSTTHKCIGSVIGLSIVSVSERAFEAMEERKTLASSFSHDLLKWKEHLLPREGGGLKYRIRRAPLTEPTHLVYALNEAVKIILEEGLRERFRRHQIVGKAMRKAIKNLGLETLADKSIASDTVTVFKMPERISDSEDVRRIMREKHGVFVAAGLMETRKKCLRIAHMGNGATLQCVIPTLASLELALQELGYQVKIGDGVTSAQQVFAEQEK